MAEQQIDHAAGRQIDKNGRAIRPTDIDRNQEQEIDHASGRQIDRNGREGDRSGSRPTDR